MAHAFWHLERKQPTGTGPAYTPSFWERFGQTQMDPRTVKILRDREEAMAAEGQALEAQRKQNELARMQSATRYISPEMRMALKQDPTGAQGMVREQYAPPKEDDDWFKKMMQYSFMQSMIPERESYSGTSVVRGIGNTGASYYQMPMYTSPFPVGTLT